MDHCTAFNRYTKSEQGEGAANLQGIHVGKAMDSGFEVRMINTFPYYLAKKERPFSDFAELVALQERTGSTMPALHRSDKVAARLVISGIHQPASSAS